MLSSDVGRKLRENIRKIISPFACFLRVLVVQCSTLLLESCTKLHLLARAMSRHNCQEPVDLKNALLWLLFQYTGSKEEAYNLDHSSRHQEKHRNCLFHWHPRRTWSSLWQQRLTTSGEENTENQEIIYLYPHKNKGWVDIYSYSLCPPQGTNASLPTLLELVVIMAVTEKKLQTCPSGAEPMAVCMCI